MSQTLLLSTVIGKTQTLGTIYSYLTTLPMIPRFWSAHLKGDLKWGNSNFQAEMVPPKVLCLQLFQAAQTLLKLFGFYGLLYKPVMETDKVSEALWHDCNMLEEAEKCLVMLQT